MVLQCTIGFTLEYEWSVYACVSRRIVFFLLYNNFIPISLYVTIELVNVGQAYLIGSDMEIYSEELDAPCAVRSSNLGQELGILMSVVMAMAPMFLSTP